MATVKNLKYQNSNELWRINYHVGQYFYQDKTMTCAINVLKIFKSYEEYLCTLKLWKVMNFNNKTTLSFHLYWLTELHEWIYNIHSKKNVTYFPQFSNSFWEKRESQCIKNNFILKILFWICFPNPKFMKDL